MDAAAIERRLRALLARHCRRDVGGLDLHEDFARAAGLDSLDRLTFLARVEEAFAVRFSDAELSRIWSLGDLVACLQACMDNPRREVAA